MPLKNTLSVVDCCVYHFFFFSFLNPKLPFIFLIFFSCLATFPLRCGVQENWSFLKNFV